MDDYKSATRRATPFDLVDGNTLYDGERCVEACATVLEPFRSDCGAERLMRLIRSELENRTLPKP